MILPKAQRGNSFPALYFTPPFPYPAEEPRSLSIRIFLIRSSRLGMSGWSSKRRENQSRLPLRKICSRWTSPTASSIPSPRLQAYSSAAYSFLLLPVQQFHRQMTRRKSTSLPIMPLIKISLISSLYSFFQFFRLLKFLYSLVYTKVFLNPLPPSSLFLHFYANSTEQSIFTLKCSAILPVFSFFANKQSDNILYNP